MTWLKPIIRRIWLKPPAQGDLPNPNLLSTEAGIGLITEAGVELEIE